LITLQNLILVNAIFDDNNKNSFDLCNLGLQVSLAIRGGYVPEKSPTVNNKTSILGLN
jgi:hypothetical protein